MATSEARLSPARQASRAKTAINTAFPSLDKAHKALTAAGFAREAKTLGGIIKDLEVLLGKVREREAKVS